MASISGKATITINGQTVKATVVHFGGKLEVNTQLVFSPGVDCGCVGIAQTEAGKLIAQLPPITFPQRLAGSLGSACVMKLERVKRRWRRGKAGQ